MGRGTKKVENHWCWGWRLFLCNFNPHDSATTFARLLPPNLVLPIIGGHVTIGVLLSSAVQEHLLASDTLQLTRLFVWIKPPSRVHWCNNTNYCVTIQRTQRKTGRRQASFRSVFWKRDDISKMNNCQEASGDAGLLSCQPSLPRNTNNIRKNYALQWNRVFTIICNYSPKIRDAGARRQMSNWTLKDFHGVQRIAQRFRCKNRFFREKKKPTFHVVTELIINSGFLLYNWWRRPFLDPEWGHLGNGRTEPEANTEAVHFQGAFGPIQRVKCVQQRRQLPGPGLCRRGVDFLARLHFDLDRWSFGQNFGVLHGALAVPPGFVNLEGHRLDNFAIQVSFDNFLKLVRHPVQDTTTQGFVGVVLGRIGREGGSKLCFHRMDRLASLDPRPVPARGWRGEHVTFKRHVRTNALCKMESTNEGLLTQKRGRTLPGHRGIGS